MRSFFRRSAVALALLASLAACSPKAAKPAPLELAFTCDTNGRIEPCGCFAGQYGGLTRLKTWLDEQPAPRPLLVDVGNAIEGPADYQLLKYRYVQRAYAGMGYSALNIGEREAQLTAAELRALNASAPVPMISANVLDAATGQRLFEPWRVIEYRGRRIAIVGVLDGSRGSEGLGEGVTIEPMNTALEKLLPSLRGKADHMILLAFADEAALSNLAKQFYEFDVILGGKVRQPSQQLVIENRSIILYTTNESKAVGSLQAEMAGPSKLTPKRFDIVLLSEQIAQNQALHQENDAYRELVRKTKLMVDDVARTRPDEVPGVRPTAKYVGSESCATCHAGAAEKWRGTPHAQAFVSLTVHKSDADPTCIGCHTVGFGTASGYRREYDGKKLTGVGCESCHGPGSEHVAQRQSGEKVLFKFRPLGAADCTTCHHGEFSRPFKWESFWPAIKHGKEPTVALK
jgi:nitrate/TMAO reductase-like tetraheme cytochrome c subunit